MPIQGNMSVQEALQRLGLAAGAGRAKIRHAYAQLSKKYHVETDPEEFSRLHEAYQTALAAAGREGGNVRKSHELDVDDLLTQQELGNVPSGADKGVEDKGSVSGMDERGSKGAASGTDEGRGKDSASKAEKDYRPSASNTEKPSTASPAQRGQSDLLDRLLGKNFSIQNCSEPIQLLHYRCRYDETSSDIDTILLRITNAEQGITDEAYLRMASESVASLPNSATFLGTPWKVWKTLDWTCIVCHPDFYRVQYTPAFLSELHHFLQEETLNLRDGIRQELYFALCMAYGFFPDETEDGKTEGAKDAAKDADMGTVISKNSQIAEIETLLRRHPRHSEYRKDLALWPDCRQARQIVLFCQKMYDSLLAPGQPDPERPLSGTSALSQPNQTHPFSTTSAPSQPAPSHPLSPAEAAADLLLDDETPAKAFLYDHLASASHGSLAAQFAHYREAYRELARLRREFITDFINLLDYNIEENYIYNDGYLPLATRLGRIRERYLTRPDWEKIICRPAFFAALRERILPRKGFATVPYLMHYDVWKMLRSCFVGSSAFRMDCIHYLTEEYYFPEYEKRYQRELVWENEHTEEAYFKETFPVPALSQGKRDLLAGTKKAVYVKLKEIEKIFGNLTFDAAGLDFLTRISNAMTHFKFLVVTQKHEKEAVPGDAFCFLEDKVFLYRKKENIICYLTHQVFYDLISWKFEAVAFPAFHGKPGYDDAFLDTACKNLYHYRCYVTNKKN